MDGARVAMESGVEDGFRRARIEALVVLALVCGRKRTGVIERGVRWFCGNAVVESEGGCAEGKRAGFQVMDSR
jgi:hypothetical protein